MPVNILAVDTGRVINELLRPCGRFNNLSFIHFISIST